MKASALIFLLLLLTEYVHSREARSNPVALLTRTRGLVTATPRRDIRPVSISKGYFCSNGTIVTTRRTGAAQCRFVESGSLLSLSSQSEVVLRRIESGERVSETIELREGVLSIETKVTDSLTFEVFTPSALISFRNTRALIIYDPITQLTTVYNFEGSARAADLDAGDWVLLEPYGVAYCRSMERPSVGPIHPEGLPRLMEMAQAVGQLRSPPAASCELTVTVPSGGTTEPQGTVVVLSGMSADLIALPAKGMHFVGWRVIEGNAFIANHARETTLVIPSTSCNVEAVFTSRPAQLTIRSEGSGRVVPAGRVNAQPDVPLKVRAIPKRGYDFVSWSDPNQVQVSHLDSAEAQLVVTGSPASVIARFRRQSVNVSVGAGEGGKVTPSGLLKLDAEEKIALRAFPYEGYRFLRWEIASGRARIEDPRNAETVVECDSGGATIFAHFSNREVELAILPSAHATVQPAGSFFVDRHEPVTLEGSAQEGREITGWKVVQGRAQVEGADRAVARLRTPAKIQPIVVPRRYSLSVSGNRNGRVIPSGLHTVTHGDTVTVMARAKKRKHFLHWRVTGGWAQILEPYQRSTPVVLTAGDAALAAEFSSSVCSLRVQTTPGGTVDPAGFIRNCKGCALELTAIPNPRVAFVGWVVDTGIDNIVFSDSLSLSEQTVTTVGGYAVVRAQFSENAGALTVLTNGMGKTVPEGKRYVPKDRWVSLRAIPNDNQVFVQWVTVAGEGIQFRDPLSAETEVLLTADDCTIKALFRPDSTLVGPIGVRDSVPTGMSLITFVLDSTRGSIDNDLSVTVPLGKPLSITATAKGIYAFQSWQTMGSNSTASIANASSPSTTILPLTERVQIMVSFVARPLKRVEATFTNSLGETKRIIITYQ